MARGARGERARRASAAIELLSGRYQRRIFRCETFGFLASEEYAKRFHVLGRQIRHHSRHHRIVADSALEMHQLQGDILAELPRERWIDRCWAVPIGAVAGGAYGVDDLLRLREVGLVAAVLGLRRDGGHDGDPSCDQHQPISHSRAPLTFADLRSIEPRIGRRLRTHARPVERFIVRSITLPLPLPGRAR